MLKPTNLMRAKRKLSQDALDPPWLRHIGKHLRRGWRMEVAAQDLATKTVDIGEVPHQKAVRFSTASMQRLFPSCSHELPYCLHATQAPASQCLVALKWGHSILRPRNALSSAAPGRHSSKHRGKNPRALNEWPLHIPKWMHSCVCWCVHLMICYTHSFQKCIHTDISCLMSVSLSRSLSLSRSECLNISKPFACVFSTNANASPIPPISTPFPSRVRAHRY